MQNVVADLHRRRFGPKSRSASMRVSQSPGNLLRGLTAKTGGFIALKNAACWSFSAAGAPGYSTSPWALLRMSSFGMKAAYDCICSSLRLAPEPYTGTSSPESDIACRTVPNDVPTAKVMIAPGCAALIRATCAATPRSPGLKVLVGDDRQILELFVCQRHIELLIERLSARIGRRDDRKLFRPRFLK